MRAQAEPGSRPAYDEMLDGEGRPRPGLRTVVEVLESLGPEGLAERARLRDAYLDRQGITFSLSGRERPLPLDLVPRVVGAEEWDRVDAGIRQRIKALELFLTDVYGPGEVLRDGIVPRRLVTSSSHYHRAAFGLVPPNGVRIAVAGIDLIRDEQGEFRVLEDNLRSPSGVSYVLENRRTLAHVLPEVFAGQQVRSVAEYPERLLDALRAAAPSDVSDPTVAVLTPGVHNSAHFEHAFLARSMGAELVEGRDLFCRDDRLWMRTVRGARPIHVVYRRIDDEYLDPVHFHPESLLGVPGLLNAARAGNVAIANAVGNGVADDKAVYTYVPDMIEYYLGERPLLPNVETYDLGDPDQRSFVLERLDRMVVKPVDGSGGYGLTIGTTATDAQLAVVADNIRADPRDWIAQPIVTLSTCPTVIGEHSLESRHVDLRPFAVNDGDDVYVLPGGLTRVALPEGSLVVNSSQGGGSKDTWVLDEGDRGAGAEGRPGLPRVTRVRRSAVARQSAPATADDRLRQQEGQQQQSGPDPARGGPSC
ncbi:MAG: circularly permuted type 2 ATP-grasp protein [Frankiales bacterium]|nr:circularly permuted type 2 ATP-grasp protein [Frankiales bacterium]